MVVVFVWFGVLCGGWGLCGRWVDVVFFGWFWELFGFVLVYGVVGIVVGGGGFGCGGVVSVYYGVVFCV